MKPSIFIDGEHGTTGLQIRERLAMRDDINILSLAMEDRRDADKRRKMLGSCDVAILCLPDDAAIEAVTLIEEAGNSACKIIDTSTAHRTHPDWAFGFAELDKNQSEIIRSSKRISNPGCYSTGAIALLKPLIETDLMAPDCGVTINAISGYTGGGKQLIAQMEDASHEDHIKTSFHLYAMNMQHKHVPEIMERAGLNRRPIFMPSVARFAQGMLVSIPLHLDALNNTNDTAMRSALEEHYSNSEFVKVASLDETNVTGQLKPEDYANRDDMKLWVFGDDKAGHVNLVAQLDNLGKGASGAAVQNLNLVLS